MSYQLIPGRIVGISDSRDMVEKELLVTVGGTAAWFSLYIKKKVGNSSKYVIYCVLGSLANIPGAVSLGQ